MLWKSWQPCNVLRGVALLIHSAFIGLPLAGNGSISPQLLYVDMCGPYYNLVYRHPFNVTSPAWGSLLGVKDYRGTPFYNNDIIVYIKEVSMKIKLRNAITLVICFIISVIASFVLFIALNNISEKKRAVTIDDMAITEEVAGEKKSAITVIEAKEEVEQTENKTVSASQYSNFEKAIDNLIELTN